MWPGQKMLQTGWVISLRSLNCCHSEGAGKRGILCGETASIFCRFVEAELEKISEEAILKVDISQSGPSEGLCSHWLIPALFRQLIEWQYLHTGRDILPVVVITIIYGTVKCTISGKSIRAWSPWILVIALKWFSPCEPVWTNSEERYIGITGIACSDYRGSTLDTYTQTHRYIRAYTHTHIHTYTHIHTHTHRCIHTYTQIHTHRHKGTNKNTHTYRDT